MVWPLQSECDEFYGNPRNPQDPTKPSPSWESANIVRVKPPFALYYDGRPVTKGIAVHRKVSDSLGTVFGKIWQTAGQSQSTIDTWGMSIFGGAYNYRLMRGGNRLSMHAYGCAVDFDPDRNPFRSDTMHFASVPEVVDAFENEGWVWGGRWSSGSRDGMHFQAARIR